MSFETKMVRQTIPQFAVSSMWGATMPADGSQMSGLTPPDLLGDWRFRDMVLLPAPTPGYTINNSPDMPTCVPGGSMPTECLVIWERYKEEATQ